VGGAGRCPGEGSFRGAKGRGDVLGRGDTLGGGMVGDPGRGVHQERSGRCPGVEEEAECGAWAGGCPKGGELAASQGGERSLLWSLSPLLIRQVLGTGALCAALPPSASPVRVSPCL